MKKKRSSNSSLPEDLVIEILSLLSIKTLLRFKCVCKSWYDLILSSSFISMHRVNSNHHRLILGHKVPPYHFRVLSCNTIDVISEDHRFYEHNCPLWSYQRLLGSYNGVVCLANEFEGTVALWNPATGRYKIANQSSINETSERIRWKYAPDTPVSIERLYAFGYDFKTDDYKVMSFITIRTDRIFPNHINEIYSFNTGSWTSSNAVIPRGLYFPSYPYSRPRPRACVNGIYSTIACSRQPEEIEEYARKAYKSFLFTVDMSNDKFITTHMPREAAICEVILRRWKEGSRVLTQVNESVTLVVRTPERKQIWVYTLNEYGPDGIWTRLYTIAPLYELLSNSYIDGFWRNKLILQKPEHCSGDLLLCDPKTHEVEMVEIRSEYYQILEYKESWSWPLD